MKVSDPLFEDKMDSIIKVPLHPLSIHSLSSSASYKGLWSYIHRLLWISLMMRKSDYLWRCMSA